MASNYPTTLDTTSTFPTDVTDDTDSKAGTPRTGLKGFLAQLLDDQNDAIVKIETELGVVPKGTASTVADRLNKVSAKQSVQAASTANITLPPGGTTLTVDGVVCSNGTRLLLKDQTLPAANGIYEVSGIGTSVVLTRSGDADTGPKLVGAETVVEGGATSINAESKYAMVTSEPFTLGTTAARWTRTYPTYPPYIRDFWQVGTVPPLTANMDRMTALASVAQTAITALSSLHGGTVLRAGTTYTNVNSFCTATGSGAVTLNHYSIVRQSDRQVLQRTANSTSLPGLGEYPRALQAALTVDVDTPVWIMWSTQVATTSPAFAGQAVLTALVQPLALRPPIFLGNSTTTPTSTPPTVGAVQGAPTTATSPLVYFWLT